jgi:ATP-dependent phosphoenolpyruvate carboxykinase
MNWRFHIDWTLVCAPGFMADPAIDGTRQSNFTIIDSKIALIGGTGYTGEMKRFFSALNFILPVDKNITYALQRKRRAKWRYCHILWFIRNRKKQHFQQILLEN